MLPAMLIIEGEALGRFNTNVIAYAGGDAHAVGHSHNHWGCYYGHIHVGGA